MDHQPTAAAPERVAVTPGVDLTIPQLVAVARGDGNGHYAQVELSGRWRDACRTGLDHLHAAMDATADKSIAALADQVRARFAGRVPPPALADLLAAPRSESIDRRIASRALIYGVTTGFGVNKDRMVESLDQIHQMQVNLLRSHACGVGPPLPTEVVRAMMLLRLRTFVEGRSCVRPEAIELLRDMLNAGVHPWVPEQGSVGSSGDLCPLAHLTLVMIGEGLAWHEPPAPSPSQVEDSLRRGEGRGEDFAPDRGPPRPAGDALKAAGLESRILTHLAPKEGLAFINGTTMSTALAALAAHDAGILLGSANLAAAMSLQALHGCSRAFDPKVHAARRHDGQARAAREIMDFASRDGRSAPLLDRSDDVQDPYSLRCAPAVHGAAHTAIEHARSIIENEINAITDNPLFFAAPTDSDPLDAYSTCIWKAYSAGNFHGEPIGMVADYLKIAIAELANISERRTQCLLDRHHNRGLPANLWPENGAGASAGLNSGLMIAQYTAASLVSENKVLAHPASVDSIPTSSNAEDHNAMSSIAARHLRRMVDNIRHVLAIEILAAAQALEIRMRTARADATSLLSTAAESVLAALRAPAPNGSPAVPFLEDRDVLLWPLVAAATARIASGEILATAQRAIGR